MSAIDCCGYIESGRGVLDARLLMNDYEPTCCSVDRVDDIAPGPDPERVHAANWKRAAEVAKQRRLEAVRKKAEEAMANNPKPHVIGFWHGPAAETLFVDFDYNIVTEFSPDKVACVCRKGCQVPIVLMNKASLWERWGLSRKIGNAALDIEREYQKEFGNPA